MINSTTKKVIIALLLICALFILGFLAADIYFDSLTEDKAYTLSSNDVRVHFIDVGQGDCTLIQAPEGNVLIDSGTPESRNSIIKYIDSLDISDFEYAIFTHPHSDHIGSAAELIERYDFNNVILPDAISTSVFYENLLDALEEEECSVILGEAGKSYAVGSAIIDIFAPRDYYYPDDLNDMSIVAKLTYGDTSFLFTGDAESFSERQMVKHNCDLNADVLKVGHHGSSTSSCEEFIDAVSPNIAIISAGENNDYGHPHRETVRTLEKIDAEMYITYECGSIVVSTDGTNISVYTEK